ncbi:MAG: glycosyltransferase family 2 protein [Candidatus Omnitrophica bacterium]|nr:glycosyltransferase family 2 protein [Candidatus Omnitrophota bacterium]
MKIYVAIAVYNRKKRTLQCLECLKSQDFKDIEVVICDDGSTDGTGDAIRQHYPDTVILTGDGNFWWSKSMNQCLRYILKVAGPQDYVLTLNDDLVIDKDYVSRLLACAKEWPRSLIGSLHVDKDNPDRVTDAGFTWNKWLAKYRYALRDKGERRDDYSGVLSSDMLPGRGTLISVRVFEEAGLYDEDFLPQYLSDEDFSLRAVKMGYGLHICCDTVVKSALTETGLGSIYEKPTFKIFFHSFFSVRSPNYFVAKFHFVKKHVPVFYVPVYMILDFLRIIGSFLKRYVRYQFNKGK